jgi:HEAT repeat protein
MNDLLPLLSDEDILVRAGATVLIGYSGLPQALNLLQQKVIDKNFKTSQYWMFRNA